MESGTGIGGNEVAELTPEQLEDLYKELQHYEKLLQEFKVVGFGMTGDSETGFTYDS
jgi:hypothetical protein